MYGNAFIKISLGLLPFDLCNISTHDQSFWLERLRTTTFGQDVVSHEHFPHVLTKVISKEFDANFQEEVRKVL